MRTQQSKHYTSFNANFVQKGFGLPPVFNLRSKASVLSIRKSHVKLQWIVSFGTSLLGKLDGVCWQTAQFICFLLLEQRIDVDRVYYTNQWPQVPAPHDRPLLNMQQALALVPMNPAPWVAQRSSFRFRSGVSVQHESVGFSVRTTSSARQLELYGLISVGVANMNALNTDRHFWLWNVTRSTWVLSLMHRLFGTF